MKKILVINSISFYYKLNPNTGIYGKTLDLASYDSIGVYLQIKLRDFATQISITLTSIAP